MPSTLVARHDWAHKPPVTTTDRPADIFDRAARRRRRDRAAMADYPAHAFLRDVMVEGLIERLDAVKRDFADVLDIGTPDMQIAVPKARVARFDPGFRFARDARGVQGDEDRLPFADASFDAVLSAGVLDQVNDLPGALSLIRRTLRPDGLFLGAFLGGGSLPALRAALRAAEGERPAARLHPQIDVRSAGDLLVRAGFALPVADVETFDVRYAGFGRLLDDLRGMAAANILTQRTALSRAALARAAAAFAAAAGPDGRTTERFAIVFVTGWAPDPSQPIRRAPPPPMSASRARIRPIASNSASIATGLNRTSSAPATMHRSRRSSAVSAVMTMIGTVALLSLRMRMCSIAVMPSMPGILRSINSMSKSLPSSAASPCSALSASAMFAPATSSMSRTTRRFIRSSSMNSTFIAWTSTR